MGGRELPRTPNPTHAQPPPSSIPRQTLLTTDEPARTPHHLPESGVFPGHTVLVDTFGGSEQMHNDVDAMMILYRAFSLS